MVIKTFIGGNMKTTGEILRRKRLDKDISTIRLAELLGVTQAYVSSVEKGTRPPSDNYMEKLKNVFIFTADELEDIKEYELFKKLPEEIKNKINKLEKMAEERSNATVSQREEKVIKVFGLASAGNGAIEDGKYTLATVSIPDGLKLSEKDFGLRVKGDSMEPLFQDDDLVLVDTTLCTDWNLINKKIVAVSINGEKFIKKVMFSNFRPEFHSLNPFYPPIKVNEDDKIVCHGVVTALLFRKL